MEAVMFDHILPKLVLGRGTAGRRPVVEGPRGTRHVEGVPPLTRQPLHHPLREWSPSPSKLEEDF